MQRACSRGKAHGDFLNAQIRLNGTAKRVLHIEANSNLYWLIHQSRKTLQPQLVTRGELTLHGWAVEPPKFPTGKHVHVDRYSEQRESFDVTKTRLASRAQAVVLFIQYRYQRVELKASSEASPCIHRASTSNPAYPALEST